MSPSLAPPSVEISAHTLALVADALAWPLLLLRRDGTLLHANLAAHRLLRRQRLLRLTAQGQVVPAATAEQAEFATALDNAAAGSPPRLMRWADAGTGSVCSATLSTLASAGTAPPALLLALSVDGSRNAELQAYAALHGLTQAETRVLERLARGESSVKAAQALGVSSATVRSQTATLRSKTGHTSVAALLNTLSRLPPMSLPASADGE